MKIRHLSICFWLVGYLLLAELALEGRAWARGWNTLLFSRRGATAENAARGKPEFGRLASFPFRSRIVPVHKDARTLRVWIASASHADDESLPPDRLFPHVVESRLSGAGMRVEVLNAARAGQTIEDNLATLSELGATWRPDVIVLYQMSVDINDLSEQYLSGRAARADVQLTETDPHGTPFRIRRQMTELVERTTLFAQLRANVTSRVLLGRVLSPTLGAAAEDAFRGRITAFVDRVRETGGQPVLCTFAASHGLVHARELPRDVELFLLKYNMHLAPVGWLEEIQTLNGIIREVARTRGVPLVDLEAEVGGRSEFFKDFVHFTPAGHARVGEVLSAALAEHLAPTSHRGRTASR